MNLDIMWPSRHPTCKNRMYCTWARGNGYLHIKIWNFKTNKAYLMYTAGKTKIGRKYSKIVYKDSNTTIPGVTEGLTGCKIEKTMYC